MLLDPASNKIHEAVIDIGKKSLVLWKEVPGVHPPVLLSELKSFPPIVKADPRWQEAMRREGSLGSMTWPSIFGLMTLRILRNPNPCDFSAR